MKFSVSLILGDELIYEFFICIFINDILAFIYIYIFYYKILFSHILFYKLF